MEYKFYISLICRVLLFVQIGFISLNIDASFANGTSCGKPTQNMMTKLGIYLWQNCGSGVWYLRVAGGGSTPINGLTVEGSLQSNKAIPSVTGFSLEPANPQELNPQPDIVNKTDPKKIKFRFRVWNDARDGMDFKLPDNATVCLKVSSSLNIPVIVGKANTTVYPPINLLKSNSGGCVNIAPILMLLLDDVSG